MKYLQKSGFTLIELLITMSILGILTTIGFGNFRSARIKAADAKRKSDLTTIAKSLEAYQNDHRGYPLSDSNNLIICQPNNTTCNWGSSFTDGQTVYSATLPTPEGYSYLYISNGSSYTLYAKLENTNDPAIINIDPPILCGTQNCNYKITSSNLP